MPHRWLTTYQGLRPGWMTPGNGGRSTRPESCNTKWFGQGVEATLVKAIGTGIEATPGVGITHLCPHTCAVRLTSNKHCRLEPVMTSNSPRLLARPQAALAQLSEAKA